MEIVYKKLPADELQGIKHLWEKLRLMHYEKSNYFKDFMKTVSFETRCEKFLKMGPDHLSIDIALFGADIIGYCISSYQDEAGEIDSLFVEKQYRSHNIGEALIQSGIDWLREKGCKKIMVSVAEGNEEVFGFYRKQGFYPRMTCLELKN